MVIYANMINDVAYSSTYTVNGGRLASKMNHAYLSPYQIKFAGTILKTAGSTTYDAMAHATYPVVVPCGQADRPEGWAFRTTARTDLLPGASTQFFPEDGDIGESGYAEEEAVFTAVTLVPLTPGEKVGFPMAASQTFEVGDLVAVANDGLVRKGNELTNVWILGRAERAATSASTVTVANVKYVAVRIDPYFKSA